MRYTHGLFFLLIYTYISIAEWYNDVRHVLFVNFKLKNCNQGFGEGDLINNKPVDPRKQDRRHTAEKHAVDSVG